jgi:transposase
MPSNPQLKLMTELLHLEGVVVTNYQIITDIGIVLHLENIERETNCIYCGNKTGKIHQNNQLTIRDLPFGEQALYLRINRRQMRCERCGKKFTEELNYLPKKRTYTDRFRKKIVAEVLNSDLKNTAERNGISEQEIETMLKDLGEELITAKPQDLKKLGIDEIAMIKGQGNYYAVLVDIDTGKIIGLVEKRTEEALTEYLKRWGEEVLSQIEEVSIDLWIGYKNVAEKLMPQAQIVADRFHVMKQVTGELDEARKQVKRETVKIKKKKDKEKILTGIAKSKYVLLKNEGDLVEKERKKLEEVYKVSPKIGEMHKLKEEFREVFEKNTEGNGGLFALIDWLKKAIDYFPKSCQTIRRWIDEITAYFDNRTTQGTVEGINNKLKVIKRRGYGFRNFKNFSIRCLLNWHFAS